MKAVSALSFVLVVAGIAGLLAAHSLFSTSPLVVGLQAAAVALILWARLTFGWRSFHATANPTAGGLVTSGPYRFIRHPIYTGVVLFCAAGALARPSLLAAGLALVILAGSLARMFTEERLLRARYPAYIDYAARTKRMLPLVF